MGKFPQTKNGHGSRARVLLEVAREPLGELLDLGPVEVRVDEPRTEPSGRETQHRPEQEEVFEKAVIERAWHFFD